MAASAWQLYNSAKKYIGNGVITLGAGTFKMALARSASNTSAFTLDAFGSLSGEISATGGYASGGKFIGPVTGVWTTGASAKQIKFDYSSIGLTFTASLSSLNNIKYAILHLVVLQLPHWLIVSFCASASFLQVKFNVSSPNTLTVIPAATGVFTLT
jgi:hypothetical protein